MSSGISFADYNIRLLRVFGMGREAYSRYAFLVTSVITAFGLIPIFAHISNSDAFLNKIESIISGIFICICYVKFYFLYHSKSELYVLLKLFDLIWKNSENQLFKDLLLIAVKHGNIFFYFYSTAILGAIFLLTVPPILIIIVKRHVLGQNVPNTIMLVKVICGLENPPTVTLAILTLSILIVGLLLLATDSIYITLCIHTLAMLKLLQNRVIFIDKYSRTTSNAKLNIIPSMSSCIELHQTVLKCANLLEGMFHLPMLVQFSASSIKICIIIWKLSNNFFDKDPMETGSLIFLSGAFSAEILFMWACCVCGQKLLDESATLNKVLYNICWYNTGNKTFGKMVLIFLQRSQIPLKLTVGKFKVISLETFLMILRGAYTFLTFMRYLTD